MFLCLCVYVFVCVVCERLGGVVWLVFVCVVFCVCVPCLFEKWCVACDWLCDGAWFVFFVAVLCLRVFNVFVSFV